MRRLATIAALLLAACNKGSSSGEPSGPVGQPGSPAVTAPATTGNTAAPANSAENTTNAAEATAEEAGTLPPFSQTGAPRFVGLWASDEKNCASKAWQFTATTLHTPAGSSCKFEQVTQVPGGYDIQATCTAESPPTADTLHIRFAESAKAMLFDSKTIASAGLIFCGRQS